MMKADVSYDMRPLILEGAPGAKVFDNSFPLRSALTGIIRHPQLLRKIAACSGSNVADEESSED